MLIIKGNNQSICHQKKINKENGQTKILSSHNIYPLETFTTNHEHIIHGKGERIMEKATFKAMEGYATIVGIFTGFNNKIGT